MANQELYNKTYKIPPEILKNIEIAKASNSNENGLKRANYLLKNGAISYQAMKRLKNFFDYFNPQIGDKMQYALAGGNAMRQFIETTLGSDRAGVQMTKNVKQDMTTNPNSELKPNNPMPKLNEEKKKKDELKKNAVAVIVDGDNKILLLKRGSDPKIWQPSKWGLVGGAINKDETPKQAVEREILEETGLEIDKFIKTFTIQRNPDSIEHIFACRYNGEPTDIKLNEENTNYGWYDVEEMKFLDIVPNLIEYITLAFTGNEYKN
jgi:8-oxo-dGTP pyrophosphatase MutT (NUDIX family)